MQKQMKIKKLCEALYKREVAREFGAPSKTANVKRG